MAKNNLLVKKLRRYSADRLALGLIGAFTIVYLAFLGLSYRKFGFPVLDLGLFNRHMWGLVRFDFGVNPLKGWNLLGDHAHFFLVLLAPLYFFWQRPEFLLLVQAVTITLSGWPIYLIAKHYFKNPTLSALWLVPYFAYFGFWSALAYPFHDAPVAVLPIAWVLYFLLVNKNDKYLLLWLGGLLLIREDMPLVAIMVGLYMILIERKRRLGGLVVLVSSLYFWWVTRWWLPFASRGVIYPYEDTVFGHSLLDAFRAIIFQPVAFARDIFVPLDKTKSIIFMLASFGGFGLIGLEILVLLTPLWLGRFLSTQYWRWFTTQHYSASQAPILIIASVIGLIRLYKFITQSTKHKIKLDNFVFGGLIVAMIGTAFVYARTKDIYIAHLLRADFYTLSASEQSANEAIKMVPTRASVGVQSAFPQLSSRQNVYNLPLDLSKNKPDYLIMSDQFDQWPWQGCEIYQYKASAINKFGYRLIYDKNGVWLLQSGK